MWGFESTNRNRRKSSRFLARKTGICWEAAAFNYCSLCRWNCQEKLYNENREIVLGNDALSIHAHSDIEICYPLDCCGKINDWVALVALLRYSFAKIEVANLGKYQITFVKGTRPTDEALLYNIMLRNFGFQSIGIYSSDSSVLSTRGVESGIVVDLGESAFKVLPVLGGQALYNLEVNMNVGGRYMALQFMHFLDQKQGTPKPGVNRSNDPTSKQSKKNCEAAPPWTLLERRGQSSRSRA
eukprot:scaffold16396_cov140-Cylindrotheca_fusiformis.AAC.16